MIHAPWAHIGIGWLVLAGLGQAAAPPQRQLFNLFNTRDAPWVLVLDDKDNIYVSDTGNHRIRVFNRTNRFSRSDRILFASTGRNLTVYRFRIANLLGRPRAGDLHN